MKRFLNKKRTKTKFRKVFSSVISVILVLSFLAGFITIASADTTNRSLEYIEKLKSQYKGKTFRILELASSEEAGTMGYYVDGSEPIGDWKEQTSMFMSKADRSEYVNTHLFQSLNQAGVLGNDASSYPMSKVDDYDEQYPWQLTDADGVMTTTGYTELDLDAYDEVSNVTGTMVEESLGSYKGNFDYVISETAYKNFFDFASWQNSLGSELRNKYGDDFGTKKYGHSKIVSYDKDTKTISVFGSTESNWDKREGTTIVYPYYDLTSAYASGSYYSLDVVEGETYNLCFDCAVTDGMAQISIIPLNGKKTVAYSPNYSKQYYYQNAYVESGHYEYQFTVQPGSGVNKVQIRFDIGGTETFADFSNIRLYKYNSNLFDSSKYSVPSGITKETKRISAVAAANSEVKVAEGQSKITVSPSTTYTLTYHVENSIDGGQSYAQVTGYDSSNNKTTTYIADTEAYKTASGTYSFSFFTDSNTTKVSVSIGSKAAASSGHNAYFSNIALTKEEDYIQDASATHVQEYDHFSHGELDATYGDSIFSYTDWASSGSAALSNPEQNGQIEATSDGVIRLTSKDYAEQGTARNTGNYVAKMCFYYMAVEPGESYQLSYYADSSAATKFGLYFSDKSRNDKKDNYGHSQAIEHLSQTAADGTYSATTSYEFTVPANCYYVQLAFMNTTENQVSSFSEIKLRENTRDKAYYYNVVFTPVTSSEIEALDDGTDIYLPGGYETAGVIGSDFTAEPGVIYYRKTGARYSQISNIGSEPNGTTVYITTGLFDWVSDKGDGYLFDTSLQYYTAKINYEGYTEVNPATVSVGTRLYERVTSGDTYTYRYIGTKTSSFVSETGKKYYTKCTPVAEGYDAYHPYWIVSDEFRVPDTTKGEYALFRRTLNYYTYVGQGYGDFNYKKTGSDELTIFTKTVFYKGGFVNNNWFKKYVFDCDDTQLSDFDVKVVTVTPEELNRMANIQNSETTTELQEYISGFELFVISYGGYTGTMTYNYDISQDVYNALLAEMEDPEYPVPVVVDLDVCSIAYDDADGNKITKIPELANHFANNNIAGGVNEYIYRFSNEQCSSASLISPYFNHDIIDKVSDYKTNDNNPYYVVWNEIDYENTLREIKHRYNQLAEIASEATCIRYILNYRGQRPVNKKSVIRILEIEPYSDNSLLYYNYNDGYTDGSSSMASTCKGTDGQTIQRTDVRSWFTSEKTADGKQADLTYIDDKGNTAVTRFEIDTMTPAELVGKIDDIVEEYDLIYVGASIDNFYDIYTETDPYAADYGDSYPNYEDDQMDGFFYTNTGDTVATGTEKLLEGGSNTKADLAGMVWGDYKNSDGSLVAEALNKTNTWYVDSSQCVLRLSGNDVTSIKAEEIQAFIDGGLPVIVSDDLCLQDYNGTISASLSGKVFYAGSQMYKGKEGTNRNGVTGIDGDYVDGEYIIDEDLYKELGDQLDELEKSSLSDTQKAEKKKSIESARNALVCQGDLSNDMYHCYLTCSISGDIPEGCIAQPTWYNSVNGKNQLELQDNSKGEIDTDGDGVKDFFFIHFSISEKGSNDRYPGYDYWCSVNLNFSKAGLKYNGLYKNDDSAKEIVSNKAYIAKETREYKIAYYENGDNYYANVSPNPADANDLSMYVFKKKHQWYTIGWDDQSPDIVWTDDTTDTEYAGYEPNKNYYAMCCKVFINYVEPGFLQTSNSANDNYETVGGRNCRTYTSVQNDKIYVNAYRLDLKDSLGVVRASGYTLNGKDDTGKLITGSPTVFNESAKILDDRIDNCSYLFEVLDESMGYDGNVMTQNQVERADDSYRNALVQYVNLSEPEIVIKSEPASYPESITGNKLKFSFEITNATELDTAGARFAYEFYLDSNGDGQFNVSEKQDAVISGSNNAQDLKMSSATNGEHIYNFEYTFEDDCYGILPWCLKVYKVGEESARCSYSDYAYIKPEGNVDINALMIIPSDWDSDYFKLNGYDHRSTADEYGYHYESYGQNEYRGCVFLSDVFDPEKNSEIKYINGKSGDDFTVERYIHAVESKTGYYYRSKQSYTYERNGKDVEYYKYVTKDEYTALSNKADYDSSKTYSPDMVSFKIGCDFFLNIEIYNFKTLNKDFSNSEVAKRLGLTGEETDEGKKYDMLIMGFGDSYSNLNEGKVSGVLNLDEKVGLYQDVAYAIQQYINNGNPVLFCHDTTNADVDFVNNVFSDVKGWFNGIANKVANWATSLWADVKGFFTGKDYEDEKTNYDNEIHTSRVASGYNSNQILRDTLGLDRYGITRTINDRVAEYCENNNTDLSWDDDSLKYAYYELNNIYSQGAEGTVKVYWNGIDGTVPDSLTAEEKALNQRVKDMINNGYSVTWVPGSDDGKGYRTTDVFSQGYTSYTVMNYDGTTDGFGVTKTTGVTQVNKGQITTYPYDINIENYDVNKTDTYGIDGKGVKAVATSGKCNPLTDTFTVKTTHEQYYQVNMNRNTAGNGATVWYCLNGGYTQGENGEHGKGFGTYDNSTGTYYSIRNDCQNAYYVYTKGNVTYTGAGHTNTFTTFEAKLFINTLVAAYLAVPDDPTVKYCEDSSGVKRMDYLMLTASADAEETTKTVTTDKVYFRIKDPLSASDTSRTFKVQFFMNRTKNVDASGNVTYTYSDEVTDVTLDQTDVTLSNAKAAVTYSFDVPDSVLKQLNKTKDEGGTNTVTLYIKATDNQNKRDPATSDLEIRELTLRDLT